jgi:hypothetical protein
MAVITIPIQMGVNTTILGLAVSGKLLIPHPVEDLRLKSRTLLRVGKVNEVFAPSWCDVYSR